MSAFLYVAKDEKGNVVRASLDAVSRIEALASLQQRGLTVVDLHGQDVARESTSKQTVRKSGRWFQIRGLGVSTSDMSVFCRQLAISVSSGVPLRDSLESIGEDLDHPTLRWTLSRVINDLHDGTPFSEALAKHGKVFSSLFVSLIRSAEESGSMPQTLEELARYLERSDRLERKIKSITAYPIFIAVFFCIVCVVMTLWVLPEFQEIFEGFDAELPPLTTVVFGINEFIINYFWFMAAGALAAVAAAVLLGRTPRGRLWLDGMKLRMPLFGSWIRKFAVARFCRNMAMMLKGGVPITTALEITSSVSGNKVLEQSLLRARDRIISGSPISESLQADPEFPRLLVRMAAVGEESGRLPHVLEKLSEVYEDQVEGAILVAMALFEPLMIVLFGVVVCVLILAIYMPVFSVSTNVK